MAVKVDFCLSSHSVVIQFNFMKLFHKIPLLAYRSYTETVIKSDIIFYAEASLNYSQQRQQLLNITDLLIGRYNLYKMRTTDSFIAEHLSSQTMTPTTAAKS